MYSMYYSGGETCLFLSPSKVLLNTVRRQGMWPQETKRDRSRRRVINAVNTLGAKVSVCYIKRI